MICRNYYLNLLMEDCGSTWRKAALLLSMKKVSMGTCTDLHRFRRIFKFFKDSELLRDTPRISRHLQAFRVPETNSANTAAAWQRTKARSLQHLTCYYNELCNSTTQVSSCFMSFHFMRPQCRPMQAGTWEPICRASWTHWTFKTKFLNRHCMSYLPLLPVSRSFLLDFCNSFCKQTSSKHAADRQPMVNPRALALPQQREQWS